MCKGKYQEWLTEEGKVRLQGWARDGLSDEQLADKIGIGTTTLYRWKNEHREIREALRDGKEVADRKVENALYNSCFDRKITVRKAFKVKEVYYDANGKRCEKEHLETAEEDVVIPANEKAQEFWLANRKPEQWSRKEKLEVSGAGGGPLNIRWMNSPDEKVGNNA